MQIDRRNDRVQAKFIVFADIKNSRHLAYSKGLYLLEGNVGRGSLGPVPPSSPLPFFLFFFVTCPVQLEFILCGHWMLLNLERQFISGVFGHGTYVGQAGLELTV